MKETIEELYKLVGLPYSESSKSLDLLEVGDSRYIRDLKVNVGNVLQSDQLDEKETALLALCIAANANNDLLIEGFTAIATKNEASKPEIAEAIACASLLASNNVFYRFRHFMDKESYNKMPGKIRMNIMMKPVTGKPFFELMSLAISAVNGCELCVTSHEASLRKLEVSEAKIWDAVRLASVITSLSQIIR